MDRLINEIAITADIHIYQNHKYSIDGSRLKQLMRSLHSIIDYCNMHRLSKIVVCGDLFHIFNPSNYLISLFTGWLNRAVECGITVVIISGNHDTNGRINSLDSIVSMPELLKGNVIFVTDDDMYKVEDVDGARFYYVAWHKEIRKTIQQISSSLDKNRYNVLFAHAALKNAHLSNGRKMVDSFDITRADAKLFDKVFLGDFHLPQNIKNKYYYPGSVIRINWGERNDDKGFIHFSLGKELKVEQVPLSDIEFIQLNIDDEDEIYKLHQEADTEGTAEGRNIDSGFVRIYINDTYECEWKSVAYAYRQLLFEKGAADVTITFNSYKLGENDDADYGDDYSVKDFDEMAEIELDNSTVKDKTAFLNYALEKYSEAVK